MLCSRVKNLLSAYCDHELTGAEMLQIRKHLDACSSCRQEHAAVRQVKQLMGALPTVAAARPFQPEMLQPRPVWQSLAARHLAAHVRSIVSLLLAPVWALAAYLRQSARPLATGGALGLVILTAGALQQPRHPDAVSAHVPAAIAADDRAPAGVPELVLTSTLTEPMGMEAQPGRGVRLREARQGFYFRNSEMPRGYGGYPSSFPQSVLAVSFSGGGDGFDERR